MPYGLSTRFRTTPGPDLKINCQNCGSMDTNASSSEEEGRFYFLYIIPLLGSTNTFIECVDCKTRFRLNMTISQLHLQQPSASDLNPLLVRETPERIRILLMLSLSLGWLPIMGLFLTLPARRLTRKLDGRPKRLGKIALVISIISTIVYILALLVAGLVAVWYKWNH